MQGGPEIPGLPRVLSERLSDYSMADSPEQPANRRFHSCCWLVRPVFPTRI